MKDKGKLICRIANLVILMEDVGQGEYFVAAIVDDKDQIIARQQLDFSAIVFLEKCINVTVSEIMAKNLKENW